LSVGALTDLAHQLVVVARAPVTATLVGLWQQSPVLTGGQLTPMESPHFLQPAKKLPLLHTSAGGGLGGGGIGGGGRGGGEYFTHLIDDIICAPVTVFLDASSQHSGDVDGGLSGSPLPKPWLAHLQPTAMLRLEQTSLGGGLSGGGIGGGGRGGGEYFTHQAESRIWEPSTVTFIALSQHSPVDSNGLSGSPLPPPALPHSQPTDTSPSVHGAGPGAGTGAGAGAGLGPGVGPGAGVGPGPGAGPRSPGSSVTSASYSSVTFQPAVALVTMTYPSRSSGTGSSHPLYANGTWR